MAAPKAVREQEARAEALRQEAYGTQDTEESAPEEPESELSDDEQNITAEDEQELEPEQEESPEADDGDGDDDLQERYDRLLSAHQTLQGKYRAEVPRLQDQVRELTRKLDESAQQRQQAEAAKDDAEAKLDKHRQHLTDEFGDEFTQSMEELARGVASREVNDLRQTTQQDRHQAFMDAIYLRIPDFDQVNTDPAFVRWLRETPDPVTGFSYQDRLNQAGDARDVRGVVDVFDEFKRTQQKRSRNRRDPRSPQAQVNPKRGQGRTPPPKPEQPSYTTDDWDRLQRELRDGRWNGREDEARQLEREIHAALTGIQT